MNTTPCYSLLIVVLMAATIQAQVPPDVIQLRSGNGALLAPDPLVTMLNLTMSSYPPPPPTSADFAAAAASVLFPWIWPPDPSWIQSLPTDPAAQWIGSYSFFPRSILLAVPFNLTTQIIAAATLDLRFAVDNGLMGVYINGVPISSFSVVPSNCSMSTCPGFSQAHQVLRTDVAPLLGPGPNTLYLHYFDNGIVGGMIFSATITAASQSGYQTNSSHAHMSINGVQGSSSAAAIVNTSVNTGATANAWSLFAGGQPWELGYGLAPLVALSSGALTTSDGQIVNLDLADPTFGVLWNYFQSPPFGNVAIPFSVSSPVNLSVQMLVVDPFIASGVSLSQPTRLVVQ